MIEELAKISNSRSVSIIKVYREGNRMGIRECNSECKMRYHQYPTQGQAIIKLIKLRLPWVSISRTRGFSKTRELMDLMECKDNTNREVLSIISKIIDLK